MMASAQKKKRISTLLTPFGDAFCPIAPLPRASRAHSARRRTLPRRGCTEKARNVKPFGHFSLYRRFLICVEADNLLRREGV